MIVLTEVEAKVYYNYYNLFKINLLIQERTIHLSILFYIIAPSNLPQWVCNICSNGLRYTENEITSHILMAHKVSNMFKCPMCQFEHEDDNANIFEEHYKLQHPSVAVKCLRVFEKVGVDF